MNDGARALSPVPAEGRCPAPPAPAEACPPKARREGVSGQCGQLNHTAPALGSAGWVCLPGIRLFEGEMGTTVGCWGQNNTSVNIKSEQPGLQRGWGGSTEHGEIMGL